MRRFGFIIVMSIVVIFTSVSAQGHMLWLNVDDYTPEPGETVQIEIGWGHKFPNDQTIQENFLNRVCVLDEAGQEMPLKQNSLTQYTFSPEKEGFYRILADVHPGFLSKTTKGYKLKAKKELENALSCFRYDMRAKAVISADGKGKEFETVAGDLLEIIPLENPARLKEGDVFPLKVIYDGKPLSHAEIRATYEGFSDEPHTFAYSAMTDKSGEAHVKILKKGSWFVTVTHKVPYPDPDECDEYKYNYTFTFNVQ